MCGIYGIWHRDGRPVDLAAVQTATSRLRHRGPDDEGYLLASPEEGWCAPYAGAETDSRLALPPLDQAHGIGCSLAFGFRRLAILDLSPAGHQPMVSADGRFWIVFNGEIYNYIELREELQRLGHRFRSGGDTEVILAAYAQWGEACLDRLNGMWAFAIWDRERRELFLTRDRFGVKPLYYVATGQTFAFASEIKALVGRHALPFTPEPLAIYQFLVDGRLPDPQHGATFFAGVRSLPPGHCMRVAEGSPAAPRRYYDVALPDGHHRAQAPETIIASIHMQNCHHWRRCGGACAGVMLHSVAVEVLAASLRETVVLQQRRSQELCEYPLECFKIVDIFLQDPKNNASIDL